MWVIIWWHISQYLLFIPTAVFIFRAAPAPSIQHSKFKSIKREVCRIFSKVLAKYKYMCLNQSHSLSWRVLRTKITRMWAETLISLSKRSNLENIYSLKLSKLSAERITHIIGSLTAATELLGASAIRWEPISTEGGRKEAGLDTGVKPQHRLEYVYLKTIQEGSLK